MVDPVIIQDLQREMFGSPVKLYCLAGNATFTIQSKKTGRRFTYKISKSESEQYGLSWFVSLLNGSDNESSFMTFAMLKLDFAGEPMIVHLRPNATRKISANADSALAFKCFWEHLCHRDKVHPEIEFYHSGRCGRCGRKLTVPSSVESGFGPECSGRLGE